MPGGGVVCLRSADDFEGFYLAPCGVIGLAADPFVGADTDVIGSVLLQSGADGAGVLVAVQRHGLAAGEVLAGAVLELVAGDLAVPVPIGFQLLPRPVVHRTGRWCPWG